MIPLTFFLRSSCPVFPPQNQESQDQRKTGARDASRTHGLVAPTVVYSIEEEVVGTRFPADEDRCTRF